MISLLGMTDESVSNSSKFSIKSQIVIAKQDDTIAAMRRAMLLSFRQYYLIKVTTSPQRDWHGCHPKNIQAT